MTTLLGPEAEEPEKRESTSDDPARSIVILGWEVTLSTRTVNIADFNRTKALYTFWTVDLEAPVPRHTVEAMCALAQRYSLVYRELGVLMGDIYAMNAGGERGPRSVTLSKRSKMAIRLWRAYLLRSELRAAEGEREGRSLDTFRRRAARLVLEFDGSLTGVGVRLFAVEHGRERLLDAVGVAARYELGGQSAYQNAMEVAAVSTGLALAARRGGRGATIHLRGDSMSALEWLSSGRSDTKSLLARNAIIVCVVLLREHDMLFDTAYTHLSSEQNGPCDALSRGTGKTIGEASRSDLGHLASVLDRCNPLRNATTEEEFVTQWEAVEHLVSPHGRR
jgi:hypothetical protein